MVDFRQFYGENELSFGVGDKNTTIILGANGNGKTGIFRAIMFAMYGDLVLDQDENIANVNLVNLDKLDELEGKPVRASVELLFEFNNEQFNIKRDIISIKKEGKITNNVGDIQLHKEDSFGNLEPISEDPNVFINHILEKEIREFFFFDAEKMQLLDAAKKTKNISKEVKSGIIRLLQIKNLDDASRLLKGLISEKNSEIKEKAKNITLDQKTKEKIELELELKEIEEMKRQLISEKAIAQDEIEAIETKLRDTAQIRELLDKRNNEIRILQLKRSSFREKKDHSRKLISEMTSYLAQDVLEKNESYFQGFQEEKQDKIPLELIEETLLACECSVCHSNIAIDSPQHILLKKLKDDYMYSDTTPVINNILKTTNINRKEKPYTLKTISKKISELAREEEQINESEIIVGRLEKSIGDQAANQDDLKRLEKSLSLNKQKIIELEDGIRKYDFMETNLVTKNKEFERDINQLMSRLSSVKQDQSVKNKLEEMLAITETITTDYTSESVELLSLEMTESLHRLLDDKDRYIFKEVKINQDFEMEILDSNNINRLQDLSMGQGQIFTLSFILSLAKIASKGRNEINFPLFMDTPFGRLSGKNRDNLIKNIPNLVNQWILLLTDTELTSVEQHSFNRYDTVDHIFELVNTNGKTKIIAKENIMNLDLRR